MNGLLITALITSVISMEELLRRTQIVIQERVLVLEERVLVLEVRIQQVRAGSRRFSNGKHMLIATIVYFPCCNATA